MNSFMAEGITVDLCSRCIRYSQDGEGDVNNRKRLVLDGVGNILDRQSIGRERIGIIQIQFISFNFSDKLEWMPSEAANKFVAENDLTDCKPIGELMHNQEGYGHSEIYLGVTDDVLNWLTEVTSEREGEISDFNFEAHVLIREMANWGGPIGDGNYPVSSWEISHRTGKDINLDLGELIDADNKKNPGV